MSQYDTETLEEMTWEKQMIKECDEEFKVWRVLYSITREQACICGYHR